MHDDGDVFMTWRLGHILMMCSLLMSGALPLLQYLTRRRSDNDDAVEVVQGLLTVLRPTQSRNVQHAANPVPHHFAAMNNSQCFLSFIED